MAARRERRGTAETAKTKSPLVIDQHWEARAEAHMSRSLWRLVLRLSNRRRRECEDERDGDERGKPFHFLGAAFRLTGVACFLPDAFFGAAFGFGAAFVFGAAAEAVELGDVFTR